jgi:hypothetical protein
MKPRSTTIIRAHKPQKGQESALRVAGGSGPAFASSLYGPDHLSPNEDAIFHDHEGLTVCRHCEVFVITGISGLAGASALRVGLQGREVGARAAADAGSPQRSGDGLTAPSACELRGCRGLCGRCDKQRPALWNIGPDITGPAGTSVRFFSSQGRELNTAAGARALWVGLQGRKRSGMRTLGLPPEAVGHRARDARRAGTRAVPGRAPCRDGAPCRNARLGWHPNCPA